MQYTVCKVERKNEDGGGGMGVGWRGVRGGDERGKARRQMAAQPQRWRSLRVCRGALHKARGEPYIPPYIGCSHVLIGSPDVPLAGVRVAQWPWGNRRLRPSACVRSNTYTQVLGIPADVRVNVTESLLHTVRVCSPSDDAMTGEEERFSHWSVPTLIL